MHYHKYTISLIILLLVFLRCEAQDVSDSQNTDKLQNDSIAVNSKFPRNRKAHDYVCLKDSGGVVHSATFVWYGRQQSSDQYLSVLPYKGWTVGIGNESDKLIRVWSPRQGGPAGSRHSLRQYWHWEAGYGKLISKAKNNGRRTWSVNADWRMMYEWQWRGLTVGGGLMIGADYAGRTAGSNVNKPYSMDLSADMSIAAGVQYALWAGRKVHFTFDYHISTPFAGCFFMPDMGQAYYEFADNIKGTAHFASFHNKQSFTHDLHIDMRFVRSAWRIGVRHSFLRYSASNLTMMREDLHAYVGWIADLNIRRGTRVK